MLTDVRYAMRQIRDISPSHHPAVADRRSRALDALERVEEELISTFADLEYWTERVKGEGRVSPCGHFVLDDFGTVTIVNLSFPVNQLQAIQEALGGA